MNETPKTPQLTIVSGPMGGGKSGANTAAINGLKEADIYTWGVEHPRLMSVSKTSRGRRVEQDEPIDAYEFETAPSIFETAKDTDLVMKKVYHSGVHYGSPTPPPGEPRHLEIEVTGVDQIVRSSH